MMAELVPQLPPVVASANVLDRPIQMLGLPVTAAGAAFTVTDTVAEQPAPGE